MARSRYHFAEPDRPHFLARTVVEWLPVFTRPETAQVLFDAWIWQQGLNVASWTSPSTGADLACGATPGGRGWCLCSLAGRGARRPWGGLIGREG
jgi:hypothetical protein